MIARQLEPQLVGHLIGDFLLQLEYARHPAMELAAPDLRPVVHVDQLRPYRERVAALEHPAGQDCPDVQGAPDFLRLLRPPLVAEDGAPRHHAQLRKLRQRVDNESVIPLLRYPHLRVLTRVRGAAARRASQPSAGRAVSRAGAASARVPTPDPATGPLPLLWTRLDVPESGGTETAESAGEELKLPIERELDFLSADGFEIGHETVHGLMPRF